MKEVSDIESKPEFADRKGNFSFKWPYYIDYNNDWLIHDFTLAELKTMKRKQRFDFRNKQLDGIFDFMTLNETIELLLKM